MTEVMTDTDPRLEAAIAVLRKFGWTKPHNYARELVGVYDVLRAFDQVEQSELAQQEIETFSPVRRDWCEEHNRGSLEATDGLCPECEERAGERRSKRQTEHNATAAVMRADLPWWERAVDIYANARWGGVEISPVSQDSRNLIKNGLRVFLAFANAQPPSADECRAAARVLVGRVFDHEGNGIDLAERLGREVLIAAAKARSDA